MKIKSAEACRYDIVALGEVMLRLDPGDGRIRTARTLGVPLTAHDVVLAHRGGDRLARRRDRQAQEAGDLRFLQ